MLYQFEQMPDTSRPKVVMTCECGHKERPSLVPVSPETGKYPEEYPYGHSIPLACRVCHKQPETQDPHMRAQYIDSIEALLKRVAARKNPTEALTTAQQLATAVKSPLHISLE